MTDLQKTRAEVDEIDRQIAELFEKRMRLTEDIAEFKLQHGVRVVDPEREEEMYRELRGMASSEFNAMGIQEVLKQIISISRKRQYQIQTENGLTEDLGFEEIDEVYKNKKVVFQGVEGAYGYAAMLEYFGEDVNCFHVATFKEAIEAIVNKEANFAVLPIENSTAGIVTDMYDLLMSYDITIVDEHTLKVEHKLLGLPGTKLSDIRSVYSHPQALSQCKPYLEQHEEWIQKEYTNTAAACKKISDDGDPTQAAIGSEYAARLYGLEILAENIHYDNNNSTRFIIVSRNKMFRSDARRVSICFNTRHSQGSLYNILSHIIYNQLNMTLIESRPIPDSPWEYRFFVDFEGNLNDSAVKNALRGIRHDAMNLRILGNY